MAHSRVARLGRTDVRVAARRTVRRRAQARDRLRNARPHGVQRLHRVGAGAARPGWDRTTTADLSSDGVGEADAAGVGNVHTRRGVRDEAVRPGTTLLKIAALLFNDRFIALVVRPTIADLQSEVAAAGPDRMKRLRVRWRGYAAFWTLTLVAPFASWSEDVPNTAAGRVVAGLA